MTTHLTDQWVSVVGRMNDSEPHSLVCELQRSSEVIILSFAQGMVVSRRA
jgi:hypothetical protein